EAVDGDLIEFSPELIAALSGEISRIDGAPVIPYGATPIIEASVKKRWKERQEAQATLRDTIAIWAGIGRDEGRSDGEMYRTFWYKFGKVDVMTAQALNAASAAELTERIRRDMGHVQHLPGVTHC